MTAASPGPGLYTGEQNGISYVHGGVGKQSMEAVEKIDDGYDLKVVFVDASNRYLANVEVKIEQLGGNRALSVETDGPVLMANLPDGEYQLHARLKGRSNAKQTFTSREDDRTWLRMRLPSK